MSVPIPMEAHIQIRPFHPDDAASIEFVVLSVLQEWGSLPTSKDQQELEALQSQSPFDAFFVAEDPMVGVVGCAGIVPVNDATCELRKIYVLKKFRGQHVGQRLFDACVQEARRRQYPKMRFEMNSAMMEYLPFYIRNGFEPASDEQPSNISAHSVYYKSL